MKRVGCLRLLLLALLAGAAGCRSPYHQDRLAAFGGLTGAGIGALVGSQTGHAAGGAILGAGLGAITGSVLGSSLDEVEARNRAMIEQQYGRPIAAGPVTPAEVIQLSQAGVHDELIVNHIRIHGTTGPLTKDDLIHLQSAGVSTQVIREMQAPRPAARPVQYVAPPPVVVEEYYGPPPFYWGHYHHHHCRPRPRFGWSIGVSN